MKGSDHRRLKSLEDQVSTDIRNVVQAFESDWAPIMEFTAADTFQLSPFGDILNSLKHLSLSGEPWPDCGQDG